ncbi:MAG: TerC family protein [Alphaproteobacteria bacterium]|nr:TerC family protein [Alphaproteobacteria bacterium]
MIFGIEPGAMSAFFQVILIDLVLAGDNAVVIGLAAAGLPPVLRRKAILIGIIAATILRIGFAIIATQLLAIVGLLLVGGLLLLWVCWKMWLELRAQSHQEMALAGAKPDSGGASTAGQPKSLKNAVTQIIIADVSMSLDNVLAVAGAAGDYIEVLIFGLVLSVVLMGVASVFIARLLHRYPWIGYLGLAVILYVAGRMTWHGAVEILPYIGLGAVT